MSYIYIYAIRQCIKLAHRFCVLAVLGQKLTGFADGPKSPNHKISTGNIGIPKIGHLFQFFIFFADVYIYIVFLNQGSCAVMIILDCVLKSANAHHHEDTEVDLTTCMHRKQQPNPGVLHAIWLKREVR